jgi:hypothetical protein
MVKFLTSFIEYSILYFIVYSEVLNELFDIQMSTGEQMDMEEVNLNGRMDLEREDYPYSGANSRHIPRNPGMPWFIL